MNRGNRDVSSRPRVYPAGVPRAWGVMVLAAGAISAGCWGGGFPAVPDAPAVRAPRKETRAVPPVGPRERNREEAVVSDWEVLGSSRSGRSLWGRTFGSSGPLMVVFGGFHGDEPVSASFAWEIARHLEKNPGDGGGARVLVVPEVNPDGLLAGTRGNGAGVDLNRNFPASNWTRGSAGRFYGGARAASEPEARMIMAVVGRERPALIISVHAPLRVVNYDGPAARYAEAMGRVNGYPVEASIGYSTPGSFGTWAGIDRKIPVITLELGSDSLSSLWRANLAAVLAAIRELR